MRFWGVAQATGRFKTCRRGKSESFGHYS
jgi:hypothetical protein